MIIFKVKGRCVPKQRANVGKGNVYTPEETRNYEEYVGWVAKSCGAYVLKGDVGVVINIFRMGKGGDLDNMIKSVCDGMNKICYKDDRQIKEIVARLVEVRNEIEERVEISVRNL